MTLQEIIAILAIGDGTITKKGQLVVEHGHKQTDYNQFKLDILNKYRKSPARLCVKKNQSTWFCHSGIKHLREEVYLNSHKKIPDLLKYINHPIFALLIWLCDDGTVRYVKTNDIVNTASLTLCVHDQNDEEVKKIQEWLKLNLNVESTLIKVKSRYPKKYYNEIAFNQFYSMVLWSQLRKILPECVSIKNKFKFLEQKYIRKFSNLEYNIPTSPTEPLNKKIENPVSDDQLKKDYQELNSSYKIAAKYKISATAVKRMLKELGILKQRFKI